ncbi:MAG: zincin-like metallopeptidase domain-containing protein [Lacipirellulaceae bacterium]
MPDYAMGELVAEIVFEFICATAGISPPTIEQSAACIDGWRKKLQDDKRLVVRAAGLAQRAADRVLGVMFENESANQPPEP